MLNARVQDSGNNVDVLFAYRIENSNLYFCNPNDIWDLSMIQEISMKTNLGNLIIRSFFADPEGESCSRHFINMFKMLCYDDSVARIIMVADNAELNIELLSGAYKRRENKSFFMLKDSQNSKISVPIKNVNISYAIASALGLENHEF